MHGIMSSIAEFYSQNLANESKKGTAQKVKSGGTPGMAPFGYLNTRRRTQDGYEVRTIELDADRAPVAKWIFEAYATGEWTMQQIQEHLARRGVTTLARPSRPSRPLQLSHIHSILRNRYYTGFVKYGGAWHEGSHEPLVSEDTFQRARNVSQARKLSKEKPQKHPHYLKGALRCGSCGEFLGVELVKNRQGRTYHYFYCLGRQVRKSGCDFKAVPVHLLEERIENYWHTVTMDLAAVTDAREMLLEHVEVVLPQRGRRITRAENAVAKLKKQREAVLHAHYQGAVPLDQLKTEQERIAEQIAHAQNTLDGTRLTHDHITRSLDLALKILANAGQLYEKGTGAVRRELNASIISHFEVMDDEIDVKMTSLFEVLTDPDIAKRLRAEAHAQQEPDGSSTTLSSQFSTTPDSTGRSSRKRKNQRPEGAGSNFSTLVAGTGFEPATSGL